MDWSLLMPSLPTLMRCIGLSTCSSNSVLMYFSELLSLAVVDADHLFVK